MRNYSIGVILVAVAVIAMVVAAPVSAHHGWSEYGDQQFEITGTLGATGQWIRDQQQVYGAMEDLLTEPPPLTVDARARETQ